MSDAAIVFLIFAALVFADGDNSSAAFFLFVAAVIQLLA